jgi:molybdopterin converting factor small subunit
MKVEIQLYASLTKYMPHRTRGKSAFVDVEEGASVSALLKQLNVPMDVIKMIFLNGVHAKGPEILREGDRVGVFPPVAGG